MRKIMFFLTKALVVAMIISFPITNVQGGSYELPDIDSANFVNPKDIGGKVDPNPYFPLVKGYKWVYEGGDETITVEVTRAIKRIEYPPDSGQIIKCAVVRDVVEEYDEEDGEYFVIEDTFDWYAQDFEGNVWYFGEYSEAYEYDEDGNITIDTEGSWEAGVDDAEPGIIMLADPMPGISYQQEYYEGEAEDMGKVLRLNESVSLEFFDDFDGCLVTKEWTPLEAGVVEQKYYAEDVGLVLIEELKGKTVRVELVETNFYP